MADDGSPDPRLRAALAHDDGSPTARAAVLAALAGARVFVPVRAVSTREEVGPSGLRQESSAEMQLVLLRSASGATALPAFSDGHAVQRWQPEARPVPLPGPDACRQALDQGTLLLDPHEAAVPVSGDELVVLAEGRVPVPGTGLSTRRAAADLRHPVDPDPRLAQLLAAALAGEPVRAARLLDGPDGPVLGVVPERPLDPAGLAALAARVAARAGQALPPGGVDLAEVPAAGPGLPLRLPRRGWWPGRR